MNFTVGGTVADSVIGHGIGVVEVGEINLSSDSDLFGVAEVGDFLGSLFGLGKNGEEDGGEDRDNCDDDEKFNQGESLFHY